MNSFSQSYRLVLAIAIALTFLIPVMCFLSANVYGQQKIEVAGKTYTQEEEKWFVESEGKRYEVNPKVITVKFKADVSADVKSSFYSEQRFTEIRSNKLGFVDLEVPEGANPIEYIQRLQEENIIESAEVNTFGEYVAVMSPNDPKFTDQWHLPKTNTAPNPTDSAWEINTGSESIIIAVLDSGTDIGHEDLISNIWINSAEDVDGDRAIVPANPDHLDNDDKNGVDEDGNGRIDDLCGWDFHNNNNNVRGPYYHGTHVAGIIGAMSNSGTGLAGVAGGWGSKKGCLVMALGVGDTDPDGSILDDAIIYAADNGARIITMSLSIASSTAIDTAINYAYNTVGVFIDCAAGNFEAGESSDVRYPATNPNVVAVSSADKNDIIADHSCRGPEVELAAPGVEIWSTRLNNTYGQGNGTSYAAPQVAGVAGLILSCNTSLTNIQVRTHLQTSAVDLGDTGRDDLYGFGRLDALAGLNAAGCEKEEPPCTCTCSAASATGSGKIAWVILVPIAIGLAWRWKIKKKQKMQ